MARSKAQLKAQQQALHTQTQSNSFFQMKRSHPPGVRPTAPPALFQLGRPATGAPPVVAPAVLKRDPIQTPVLSGNSSGQAIDLTLDDDDEEDEPMGQQPVTTVSASPAAASDEVKLSMLDDINNKAAVEQSLQLTQSTSDLMAPLVEDVESDVDEDFPIMSPSKSSSESPMVPLSTSSFKPFPVMSSAQNDLASHNHTKEDVGAALDAFRKTAPICQDGQDRGDAEENALVDATTPQTGMPPVYDDDNNDIGADVDEELPSQTSKSGEGSPTTTDRLVEVENLEDGEIFEEGAPPKPTRQVQQAMIRENLSRHFDAPSADAMGIRPHLRNKKQKKRGKKKTKRKLEAMQMMPTPPGEMLPEFERSTRQRPFADTQSPGQYTMAMMRNCPRGPPMNMRPVYQDPPSAPFRPGSLLVGGHPPMRPPPLHLHTPPLPPPPSYKDSHILRVNRQGSMEMLDGGDELSLRTIVSEPPMHGGFKYRSVSMSPPRPVAGGQNHPLQRSVTDTSRLPPIPPSGYGGISNSVASKDGDDSDEVDLDSLRAAALRSKTKRPLKTSTPTPSKTTTVPAVTVIHSSSSSSLTPSPGPSSIEERSSESTSPEIDKLRLEILRSMTRNRKWTITKAINTAQVSALPVSEANAIELPNQNSGCAKSTGVDDKAANEIPANSSTTNERSEPIQPNIVQGDLTVNDRSSCKTDESTTASEQTDVGEKAKPASANAMGSATLSVESSVTTPEFRPLTACSQSVVIRLSPEDFSPRKSGDDTRMKATASSSLHDAIKEMRRKIAEREKEQTNRLLDNTAARLSKQSSGSSSSPASSSSTPLQLSPGMKVSTVAAQPSGPTTIFPEVSSSATKIVKEPPKAATVEGVKSKRVTDGANAQVKGSEGEERSIELASPSESFSAVETKPEEKPALETQERNDTSAQDVSTLTIPDVVRSEKPCDVPVIRKPYSTRSDASISGIGNEKHNFDEIRAEYEQCVAECKEADMHIARLSNEIAQLEKQLPPVG